jgi:hypothetical protein
MSANTTNNSNMSNNGVVHKETSSNSNTNTSTKVKSNASINASTKAKSNASINASTKAKSNASTKTSTKSKAKSDDDWKKYQRIKPEVTVEFPSFYHFLSFNMSLGHNGFRTRPGIDKFRFSKNQPWFPKQLIDKISLGKELAQAMRTIPAINERFYVKGIFNNAGTPENMSDMDMFEIQVMDLKPKPKSAPTNTLVSANTSAPNTSAPNTSAPNTSAPNTLAPNTSAPNTSAPKAISSLNSANSKPAPNHPVANKTIAKKAITKNASSKKVASSEGDFPPLK